MADTSLDIQLDNRSVDTMLRSMASAAIGVSNSYTDQDAADPGMLLMSAVTSEMRNLSLTLDLWRTKEQAELYKLHGGGLLPATFARVPLLFAKTNVGDAVVIDDNIVVSDDSGALRYQVVKGTAMLIPSGDTGLETDPNGNFVYIVQALALSSGSANQVQAGAVTKLSTGRAGIDSVINPFKSSGGLDAETYDQASGRLAAKFSTSGVIVRSQDFYERARAANPDIKGGAVYVFGLLKVQPISIQVTLTRAVIPAADTGFTIPAGLILASSDGSKTYTVRAAVGFTANQAGATVTAYARQERIGFTVVANELNVIVNNTFLGADNIRIAHTISTPAPGAFWSFLWYDPVGGKNKNPDGSAMVATFEPDGHTTVMLIPQDGGVAEEQHLMDVERAYGGSGATDAQTQPGLMDTGTPGLRNIHVIGHQPVAIQPTIRVYKHRDALDTLVISQVTSAMDAFLNPVTGGPKDVNGIPQGWLPGSSIVPLDCYDPVRSVSSVTHVKSITFPGSVASIDLLFYQFPTTPQPDYTGAKYTITVEIDPSEA